MHLFTILRLVVAPFDVDLKVSLSFNLPFCLIQIVKVGKLGNDIYCNES